MERTRRFTATTLLLILALCLAACARATTPSPGYPTPGTPAVSGAPFSSQAPGVQIVDRAWTAETLTARWAEAGAPVWADGDELTFVYQGEADQVLVLSGIQMPLQRLQGTDLWVLTAQIEGLSKAVIGYYFVPLRDGRPVEGAEAWGIPAQWRGPEAPPRPERAETLRGELQEHVLDSKALGERRSVTVYLPPGHDPARRTQVVYAADGQSVARMATILDPQIAQGNVPPVVVIGVHASLNPDQGTLLDPSGPDLRGQEYLWGLDEERFERHERFFVFEVAEWAERAFGVASDREHRAVFGYSNGGAFAVIMGIRHPERFGHVLAFSLARGPAGRPPSDWPAGEGPRHYLFAGTLEPFREITSQWADQLSALGVEHVYRERVCGHDMTVWEEEFPAAVAWAFGAP